MERLHAAAPLQVTMLIALLQPTPETFELFEDVMVRPLPSTGGQGAV